MAQGGKKRLGKKHRQASTRPKRGTRPGHSDYRRGGPAEEEGAFDEEGFDGEVEAGAEAVSGEGGAEDYSRG